MQIKKICSVVGILSVTLMLQSCVTAAFLTGAAAGGAKIAGDSRTLNSQANDTWLWSQVSRAIAQDVEIKKNTRITGTAYNGIILLVGQTENPELAERAKDIALGIEGVSKVYNKVSNEKPVGIINISNDAAITALVKAKLVADKEVKSIAVKVITEDQEVFLLGLVTKEEAEKVIEIAKGTRGVKKVVSAFEYK